VRDKRVAMFAMAKNKLLQHGNYWTYNYVVGAI
jgi:hypothetical protein